MNSADQISIETPELAALEYPLAGIGSRFIAVAVDYLIQAAGVVALGLVALLFLPSLSRFESVTAKWVTAIFILVPFLLQWAYFTLFETFWNGQTPGKRVAHIRVIQQDGRAISFFESLARNLIRFIDFLPTSYMVGVISIFVSARSQRLGDLAAGTLVVHEHREAAAAGATSLTRLITAAPAAPAPPPVPRICNLPADALSRLSMPDLAAIETFLERRLDMTLELRQTLAARLASSTATRMGIPPQPLSAETFLEEVAYSLRSRSWLR